MKLEPTEAQRKAMLEKLADHSMWDREGMKLAVDEMIAAANSIPESAPVGTIARRPDGGYIAIMNELGWEYFYLDVRKPRLDTDGDHADSWPQIRPDQWPDQAGLDWFPPGEEPLVPRPDPTKPEVTEVLDALSRLDGTIKSAVQLLTGFSDERLEELGGFSDPTAQQEPKLCSGCYECQAPKRHHTPRVVDRLGVDEQGPRWRNRADTEFWFQDECWNFRTRDGQTSSFGSGYEPRVGIFTEVLS